MSGKLICLVCSIFVLVSAGEVQAELVGWWRFDEGSGTVAADSSAYGNDGTLNGDPKWIDGQIGGALDFNGSSDFVEIPHSESLSMLEQITIAAWTNMRTGSTGEMLIVSKGGWQANMPYELSEENGSVIFWQFYDDAGRDDCAPDSPPADEWHHIAATYEGTIFKCYIDGELADEWEYVGTIPQNEMSVMIGRRTTGGNLFNGMIDEVMIYNQALGEDEVRKIMMGVSGFGSARGPDPANGALHEDTWITIGWKPGDFAVSHDVYFGDNFDDVNDGTGDTFIGNQVPTYLVVGFPGFPYPDGLVPGTTYYWRIDEVNDAEPNSPWKGDVWSFSIPPKTAYNPDPADAAGFVDPNVELSWTQGFGAKLHTVYFGDNFDDVNNAAGGPPQGATTYSP
ncbi:MAG: LamG domain-containing protein, partial [Planctomycetota bacterium]